MSLVKASFLCTGTQYQYRYTTKTTKRTRAQLDRRERFRVFEQPTRRFCWCDGRRRDSDEKEMNLKDATCHAREISRNKSKSSAKNLKNLPTLLTHSPLPHPPPHLTIPLSTPTTSHLHQPPNTTPTPPQHHHLNTTTPTPSPTYQLTNSDNYWAIKEVTTA